MSAKTNADFLREIEELKGKKKERKAINSKKKGNRGEGDFVKVLNERFHPRQFKRTPGSGALVGGKNFAKVTGLEEHIIDVLSSDIIVPTGFRFQLEHKAYNKDAVLITHLLRNAENDNIRQWWKEVVCDAEKTGKCPMVIIKLDRAERFCLMRFADAYDNVDIIDEFDRLNNTLTWKCGDETMFLCELKQLLKLPDEFWFR